MFWTILLLLIAIGCFVAPRFIPNDAENTTIQKVCRGVGILFFVLSLIVLGFTCAVEIPSGSIGIKKVFGKVQDDYLNDGLNFVAPWIDVEIMDIKTQTLYTGDGQNQVMEVLSKDQLQVQLDQSILYHINASDGPWILRNLGSDYKNIIISYQRSVTREESAKYNATDLTSGKRDEYQARLDSVMRHELGARKIQLEKVLVRHIELPQSVAATIEDKINAEQGAQKMQFTLAKERQEAERKRVEAQGIADYQRIITSTLTPELLRYEQIKAQKELAVSSNAKVLIMGQGGSNTPLIIGGN